MYAIDLRQTPLFFWWILCLFVASNTLNRKQTPERILLATKTHKTHKKYEQNGTTLVATDISSTWVAGEARAMFSVLSVVKNIFGCGLRGRAGFIRVHRWFKLSFSKCRERFTRKELTQFLLNFRMPRNEVFLIDTISCFDSPVIARDYCIQLSLTFIASEPIWKPCHLNSPHEFSRVPTSRFAYPLSPSIRHLDYLLPAPVQAPPFYRRQTSANRPRRSRKSQNCFLGSDTIFCELMIQRLHFQNFPGGGPNVIH